MQYVSLLPPEIKAKREQERKQGILTRVVIILFVVILAVNAFLLVSTIMSRSYLHSLQDERADLENQAAPLVEYEVLYNEMTAAEELLNTAMGRVPPWSELMQELGLTLPAGVWLSNLNVSYGNEQGSFNMQGWAHTHSGVGDMLEEIENMEQLDEIRTRVSSETDFDGREAVQFNIDAILLPGPPFVNREGEGS